MSGDDAAPPKVAHADGTLTLTDGAVVVDVTRGGGFRGKVTVPRERCRLRVMGRTIAVYDEGRLVHLCSRCKPTVEVARLVAELGDRVTTEQRTPFATLLKLREESAAYRGPGEVGKAGAGSEEGGEGGRPEGEGAVEIPPGHESLRRVYFSQAAMERDSRRLRAAGWVELQRETPASTASPPRGRLRGLLRAADPAREATEGVIIWVRPLDDPA